VPPQEWHRSSYLKQRFPEQKTAASMQVPTAIVTAAHIAGVCRMKRGLHGSRDCVQRGISDRLNGYGGCSAVV
jgi:hypothetical protein